MSPSNVLVARREPNPIRFSDTLNSFKYEHKGQYCFSFVTGIKVINLSITELF